MVAFYNQEDQDIYKTNQFMPQSRFLLNAPKPVVEEEKVTESFGIPNTNAFNNSGGNDFSVYNPDPNSIVNRNYQPNYNYRRFSEPDQSMIEMGRNQDYFYKPEPTGPQKFLQLAGSFVPGAGAAGLISPYLPVNRRRIMENELGNKGIMVNNIGQVVQGKGDYNTAENVMAGYNANLITQKTIDKRQGKIEDTLRDKYEMTDADINAVKAGTYDGPVKSDLIGRYSAVGEYGDINNLTKDESDDIYDFEKDRKKKKRNNNIINRFFTDKKQKKEDDRKAAEAAAEANRASTATIQGRVDRQYQDQMTRDGKDFSVSGPDTSANAKGKSNQASSEKGYQMHGADGGRVGYFFGGRVNFKDGGLASIL